MKISYNWLNEFVELEESPQKLAEDLSMFGHSVESIKKIVYPEQKRWDYILDFEITANRGDCLSIIGIAREVAAFYNLKLKTQKFKPQPKNQNLNKKLTVKITDQKICPRFTTRIIDNIKIKPSPTWMQERLRNAGIRPLNCAVDVTNYVMVETGQPLHAFDYNKIKNGLMNVRLAKDNEYITTLDGIKRLLNKNAIIIEDEDKIYDLAGIMGGLNSEVDSKTTTIILQAAIFDPIYIRRTAKSLKYTTEASYRYERGVDVEGTIYGIDRATELIQKLLPNTKVGELVDIKKNTSEVADLSRTQLRDGLLRGGIKTDIEKINNLLGTKIPSGDMIKYLNRLGFKTSKPYTSATLQLSIGVPSYRAYDVKIWQDLAEEIARVYNYNKLGRNLPTKSNAKQNQEFIKKECIKDILVQNGFTEIYSYSFTDKKLIEYLGWKLSDCVRVINGLSPETEYLRPSLLPSLLSAIAKNPWAPDVKIFEIGKVFASNDEKWQLGIATTGKSDLEIKNMLNTLKITATINSVPQNVLDILKIRRPVKYILLDPNKIDLVTSVYNENIYQGKTKKVSVFPPTIRDLAFIVNGTINSEEVKQTIEKIDDHILLVELFDEFYFKMEPSPTLSHPRGGSRLALINTSLKSVEGSNNQQSLRGLKNLAYHIWLQDLDHPMEEKNVDSIIKKIIKNIEQKFSAKLR